MKMLTIISSFILFFNTIAFAENNSEDNCNERLTAKVWKLEKRATEDFAKYLKENNALSHDTEIRVEVYSAPDAEAEKYLKRKSKLPVSFTEEVLNIKPENFEKFKNDSSFNGLDSVITSIFWRAYGRAHFNDDKRTDANQELLLLLYGYVSEASEIGLFFTKQTEQDVDAIAIIIPDYNLSFAEAGEELEYRLYIMTIYRAKQIGPIIRMR